MVTRVMRVSACMFLGLFSVLGGCGGDSGDVSTSPPKVAESRGVAAPLPGDQSSRVADDNPYMYEPLPDDAFWSIIDEARGQIAPETDISRWCEKVAEILAGKSRKEIIRFEFTLRALIHKANHFNVMAVCKICEGMVTDDGYLYFRAGLVSHGRDVFEAAIVDPDSRAEALLRCTDAEEVLYIADNAMMKKFGHDSTVLLPRAVAFAYYNYDFEFEGPAGEDWAEGDLPRRFPVLWKLAWGQ